MDININKSDFPYLHEKQLRQETLANGIQHEIIWRYSLVEASITASLDETEYPIIVEQVSRRQVYIFEDYDIITTAIDAWHYLDKPDTDYAEHMLGYRGYWEGDISQNGQPVLQPEVAVLLGITPDLTHVPAYIETLSQDDLGNLLGQAHKLSVDDDAIAFVTPLPVETPADAPHEMVDAMRRMRAQVRLRATRGRAGLLKMMMDKTGVVAQNGGWRVLPDEVTRRQALGLR